jgi:hypothetical protein
MREGLVQQATVITVTAAVSVIAMRTVDTGRGDRDHDPRLR